MINIDSFISTYITKRQYSMFKDDLDSNKDTLINRISNKSVCVIGGAGSIGSSFIKAILPFEPRALVVVDTNENSLAELTRDLRSTKNMYIPDDYVTYPMDFSSEVFKKMFLARNGFDIVCNFSAHKHVRSEKDIYSIEALLRNNIINAKQLLDVLSIIPPEVYFCVSTDKAANPVNVMGASKRIMEDLIFSYSNIFPVKTARFANVAFSNGSLPDGFLKRMSKLQPLSAPKDVKRYFVSPEESGQICLLACVLGENREIFYPKLEQAQMMSFDEIARNLLESSGFDVIECSSDQEAIEKAEELKLGSKQYPVHFSISDTSGEKSFEEFVTEKEHSDDDRFDSLGVIVDKDIPDKSNIELLINRLQESFDSDTSKDIIIDILSDYLPEFKHIETGKSLDSKM